MGIKNKYRQSSEGAIASYDWLDIAEGVGYKTFFGFSTDAPSATGESQYLTTSTLYSNTIAVSGATTAGITLSGAYSKTFNVPKNIKGNAFVSFGWWSNTNDMFPIAQIYKRVGGVDTLIVETSGSLVANAAVSLPKVDEMILNIPLTHFLKTDTLVLKVGITAAAGGAGAISNFGQDPQNRDDVKIKPSTQAVTTKLSFDVPFQLDL